MTISKVHADYVLTETVEVRIAVGRVALMCMRLTYVLTSRISRFTWLWVFTRFAIKSGIHLTDVALSLGCTTALSNIVNVVVELKGVGLQLALLH